MARYKPIERGQGYFLIIYPDELFNDDSLEKVIDRFIDDYVSTKLFEEKSKNDEVGQKAISPLSKLKVIVYGLSQGIESMRGIERMLQMNHPGFLFLSGGRSIDHSTICKFLNENADGIKHVFSRLLMVFEEMKCIKWESIVIDGTKISSNASKDNTADAALFKKKLKRYQELSRKIVERARRTEDQYGRDEITEKEKAEEDARIVRQREHYTRIIEKINEYEQEVDAGKLSPKDKVNLTDRESKLLKKDDGYVQGYNVQAAFSGNDILLAVEATDQGNDTTLLLPMVERVEELKKSHDVKQESEYLLDKGYFNVAGMTKLLNAGRKIQVAVPGHFTVNWYLNEEHEVVFEGKGIYFHCKGNRKMRGRYNTKENSYEFALPRKLCDGCEHFPDCWNNKDGVKRRVFSVSKGYVDNKELWKKYKSNVEDPDWLYTYNKRIGKEHNFHDLKSNNGLWRINWRGRPKCNTISLVAGIAYNLKKLRKIYRDHGTMRTAPGMA